MDFIRSAASVGALATDALRSCLTLVKVFLHTTLTDIGITSAIAERAARFIRAVTVYSTGLDTLNHRRAYVCVAAP